MSIIWGEISFDGPFQISDWDPPNRAGIYAIMYKQDVTRDLYTLVYIGESGNLNDRGFYQSHHRYNCWISRAGSERNIYIGTYLMPNSTDEQRREIEGGLINRLDPACNRT